MRTTLATLVAAGILGTSLVACVQQNDDPHPFARVLPKANDVRIALPETSAQQVVGETSPWYVVTRDLTRSLNGGTAFVLGLAHAIVLFPPTTVAGDTYTWGPWSEALSPAEYRMTVTEQPDGSYQWALDGRNKTEPGAGFETVVGGNADRDGTGTFSRDFDAAERVNPRENDGKGVLSATYDVPGKNLALAADAVEDRGGVQTPAHYEYAYHEAADGAGDMVFAVRADSDDPGPLAEEATVRSRWHADGAGRADLRLRGGDLQGAITASDCWDSHFLRVYYADSVQWQPTEGNAAACAYQDLDLPQ